MIQAIRRRNLYRRLAVFSSKQSSDRTSYGLIYETFQTYRRKRDWKAIEEERKRWEDGVIQAVRRKLDMYPDRTPAGWAPEVLIQELKKADPLILVDIPVKAMSAKEATAGGSLWYLPEEYIGVHSRNLGSFPQFRPSNLSISGTEFDREVGKIRVLAHPQWRSILDLVLNGQGDVLNVIRA